MDNGGQLNGGIQQVQLAALRNAADGAETADETRETVEPLRPLFPPDRAAKRRLVHIERGRGRTAGRIAADVSSFRANRM